MTNAQTKLSLKPGRKLYYGSVVGQLKSDLADLETSRGTTEGSIARARATVLEAEKTVLDHIRNKELVDKQIEEVKAAIEVLAATPS